MKTLVSMTDFVIGQIKTDSTVNDSFKKDLADIRNYALFLKKPLTLGMFVPCNENGNAFTEIPDKKNYKDYLSGKWQAYEDAKEKVLFKGFEYEEVNIMGDILKLKSVFICMADDLKNSKAIIEDLLRDNKDYELTESALKEIFG